MILLFFPDPLLIMIIIKVFLLRKSVPGGNIYSKLTNAHTGTLTHQYNCTLHTVYNQLKSIINRDLRRRKILAARNG